MAYSNANKNKLTNLESLALVTEQLKAYAKKSDVETLKSKVNDLEGSSITDVKVNGTSIVSDKVATITFADGVEAGTIKVNETAIKIAGLAALAYKENISLEELTTELQGVIEGKAESAAVSALSQELSTLIGDTEGDDELSVREIAVAELTKQLITDDAKEHLNELKEIAAWIQNHPDEASAMNLAIEELKKKIGNIPDDAEAKDLVGYIKEVVDAAVEAADMSKFAEKTEVIEQVNGLKTTIETSLLDYVKTDTLDSMKATTEEVENMIKQVLGDDYVEAAS